MTWARAFGVARLIAGAVALTVAGLLTSSIVSIALWVALALSGDRINTVVVAGASLGIAAWVGVVFGASVLLSRLLRVRLSKP